MDKTVFRQLLDLVSQRSFRRIASGNEESHGNQKLTAWEQFICMSFAQLTNRQGLRDIEICLRGLEPKLYHIGLHSRVSRSTLARANNKRPSKIFLGFAQHLIKEARELYRDEKFDNELNEIVYVIDSTYISLCLALFPWARIGSQNIAGLKLHAQLDLRGSIPSFIDVSKGSYPDNKMLDNIVIEPGAFYVLDKAYIDFKRLNKIDEDKGFFVARFKQNIAFSRISSNVVDQAKGVLLDQVGKFSGSVGKKNYQSKIRKVVFHERDSNKTLTFMTNNFSVQADVVAKLYKYRWRIEIFFKWVKQNLRIEKFYGTSLNAEETQIWIAISTYLLVAIAKKKLKLTQPLAQILHILSVSLFEKELLSELLSNKHYLDSQLHSTNQLNLFT